jgi:indole-3-glycerol phosphate synthase
MDVLNEIITLKRARLERARAALPLEEMKERALARRRDLPAHALRSSLEEPGLRVIAEIKRASPSLGPIRENVEPGRFAEVYETNGAAAISVLTEEDRFKGSLNDLRVVKSSVQIPVLRKDFIFDDYQVYEAAEAGADALLLIVAALNDDQLAQLRSITEETLGMDALIEVHTAGEVERALKAGARIIGVNNRDLRTFNVSLETSFLLISSFPPEILAVTESGLRSHDDLVQLERAGFRGFLVGETLMRAPEPGDALRTLLGNSPTTFQTRP